jgi:antitoxin YefM
MHTTYQLHSRELDEKFLEAIKHLFADKYIKIVITELDDTAYLSSSEANHEHLMRAIRDIGAGENLQVVDIEDFA